MEYRGMGEEKMRKGGGSGTLDHREYVTFAGRNLRQ